MSQIFDEEGKVIPVTIVSAGPCYVTQIKKSEERDGYNSVQIGFEEIKKEKKIKKTMGGKHFKHLKESKGENKDLKIGDKIDVSIFKEKEKVKVVSKSKGKGFTGVIKRWNFSMKPRSHGTKHEVRAMGSTGGRFPQRVVKGRKMPGRLGGERITIKGLEIIKINPENNLLIIKGAIPGAPGSLLEISI